MSTIRVAHLREQGINFAVFEADATNRTTWGRQEALARLVVAARRAGLRVEKAALAYSEGGRTNFFGTPDLVRFLCGLGGIPRWTHTINV